MPESVVIARPSYEIEMFGGPGHVVVKVGSMVRVHPASDLFMQGAKHAQIRQIKGGDAPFFMVRPYIMGTPVGGKLRALSCADVLVDEKGV